MLSVESTNDAFHWMPIRGQFVSLERKGLRRRPQTLSYGSVSMLLFPAGKDMPAGPALYHQAGASHHLFGAGLAKSTPSEPHRADCRPVVELKALSNHQNCRGEGIPCHGRGTGALTNHHGDTEAMTRALCPPVVSGEVGGTHSLPPSCGPSSGYG